MSGLTISLGNLLAIAVTLGLIVALKRKLGGRNFIAALLSTVVVNIGALSIGSTSGYGMLMMATLSLSPFILVVLWLGFTISDWLAGLTSNRPASHHFGRKGGGV